MNETAPTTKQPDAKPASKADMLKEHKLLSPVFGMDVAPDGVTAVVSCLDGTLFEVYQLAA